MSDDALGSGPEVILKPDALLALHSVTEELFETLKRWFHVPNHVSLDLTDIDAVVREMSDPVMIAALAMRKLQALRLSTAVIFASVCELQRVRPKPQQRPAGRAAALRQAMQHAKRTDRSENFASISPWD